MRRIAFLCVCVTCLCGSCGPSKPTPSRDVNYIAAEDLCRCFRDNPRDRKYLGQLVQCVLEPRSYRVTPGRIEAFTFATDRHGCIVFEASFTPADDSRRLVVTGRCSGIVHDGIQREATTDFYVLVTDTSVTTLEP